MNTQKLKKVFSSTYRQYARVLAVVVGVVSMTVLVGFLVFPKYIAEAPSLQNNDQNSTTSERYARSAPSRIVIQKIALDTTFELPLRLNPDKTVMVPETYDKVAWYQGGATPGEVGPSVILGHVDSYEGAAVFYHLGALQRGDEIVVSREDGTVATFEVTSLERYARKDFPSQLVYGQTEEAVLRLVTCSGIFDKGKQEYSHNLVVFAKLKEF